MLVGEYAETTVNSGLPANVVFIMRFETQDTSQRAFSALLFKMNLTPPTVLLQCDYTDVVLVHMVNEFVDSPIVGCYFYDIFWF